MINFEDLEEGDVIESPWGSNVTINKAPFNCISGRLVSVDTGLLSGRIICMSSIEFQKLFGGWKRKSR